MEHSSKIAQLKKNMLPYEKTNPKSSIWQIVNTLGPLILLWIAAYFSLGVSYWLTLPIVIVAAGFVVRTFILFHDCCHGSFFKNKKINDVLGTITGVLTLVPYRQWKYSAFPASRDKRQPRQTRSGRYVDSDRRRV